MPLHQTWNQGFLGTAAPRYADLVLLLEIAMGLALLFGALLARLRKFRAHAFCQSAIVLLNAAIIALVMLPSFRVHVAPKIPLKLGKAYYALATAHAALGSIVESAALYILLAAGTKLLPKKLHLTRYKLDAHRASGLVARLIARPRHLRPLVHPASISRHVSPQERTPAPRGNADG